MRIGSPGALAGRKPESPHWVDRLLSLSNCPDPCQLMQFKQLLKGGGHCSPHTLRCRSWACLGCVSVAGESAATGMRQGLSMPQECCFQRQGGDRVNHYSLGNVSATSAVTTAGEGLIYAVGLGQYVGFYRRKVLGDLNVSLYSGVCGIETRKHVQNPKWTTTLQFIEEMEFKKKERKTLQHVCGVIILIANGRNIFSLISFIGRRSCLSIKSTL